MCEANSPHYEDNSYDIQHITILDIPFNMYHFNSKSSCATNKSPC